MNQDITTPEFVNGHLTEKANEARKKAEELTENSYTNKLDFIFDKHRLIKYADVLDSVSVKFNQTKNNVEEFTVKTVKTIDDEIKAATTIRSELPSSDEQQVDEKGMMKRGENAGEITALVDVKLMVFEISSNLARKLARQMNR